MKIAVNGCLGRMGSLIARKIHESSDLELAAGFEMPGIDPIGNDLGESLRLGTIGVEISPADEMEQVLLGCDALIDFTAPSATEQAIRYCLITETRMVIGTTGLDEEQMELVDDAAREVAVVQSPNYAVGVNVFWNLVRSAAELLPGYDAEVIEAHHRHKKDAPSGTALRAAEEIRGVRGGDLVHGREGLVGERSDDEIGMHAVRAGDIAGDHTVLLAGDGERVEITHRAHGRDPFANGALRAARYVEDRGPGRYDMTDVLSL